MKMLLKDKIRILRELGATHREIAKIISRTDGEISHTTVGRSLKRRQR